MRSARPAALPELLTGLTSTMISKERNRFYRDSPLVVKMKEWVDEMYADNRTTSLSNKELENKVRELTQAEK